MARCLVTGGLGFIGSHLAIRLAQLGHTVGAFDISDKNPGRMHVDQSPERNDISVILADCSDPDEMSRVFSDFKPDHVYHFAAYAAEGLSHHVRSYNYRHNLMATTNIVNQCAIHNVTSLVFASSAAVYGHQDLEGKEDGIASPIDPYGVAKLASEMDIRIAAHRFNFKWYALRMHNVYGPWQNLNDPYRNVVGIFIRQALNGEPLTIYGDGSTVRCFTYIDDVIKYAVRTEHFQPGVYNVGSSQDTTILGLARSVCEITGRPATMTFLPARDEASTVIVSHKKIQGFHHPLLFKDTDLMYGLRQTIEWAKNREWVGMGSSPPPIEVAHSMYKPWADRSNVESSKS